MKQQHLTLTKIHHKNTYMYLFTSHISHDVNKTPSHKIKFSLKFTWYTLYISFFPTLPHTHRDALVRMASSKAFATFSMFDGFKPATEIRPDFNKYT